MFLGRIKVDVAPIHRKMNTNNSGEIYARARIENRAGVDAGIEFVNNDAGGDDFSALEP